MLSVDGLVVLARPISPIIIAGAAMTLTGIGLFEFLPGCFDKN
jgi:hypothetical protein